MNLEYEGDAQLMESAMNNASRVYEAQVCKVYRSASSSGDDPEGQEPEEALALHNLLGECTLGNGHRPGRPQCYAIRRRERNLNDS